MNRRTYLAAAATLTTTGLAGCSGMDVGDNKVLGQPTKKVSKKDKGGKHLGFGETLDLPRVSITVSDPRATKTQRWTENGKQRTAKAGEGKQWLVAHVKTQNTTDRKVRLPMTLNFKGVVGDTMYHAGRNKTPAGKYMGGKAPAGEHHEGDMMFLTPDTASADDLRVFYKERRPSGKKQAWWEP